MGSIINNLSNPRNKLLHHHANFSPTLNNIVHSIKNPQATDIVDSDATDIYFSDDAPIVNIDLLAPKFTVGTATGHSQQFKGTGELNFSKPPSEFPVTGHIMTGFRHTLLG